MEGSMDLLDLFDTTFVGKDSLDFGTRSTQRGRYGGGEAIFVLSSKAVGRIVALGFAAS